MAWPPIDQFPPVPNDPRFALEPLGPQHNERDHVAWMTSIEHVHATPGFSRDEFGEDSWPVAMTLEQNLDDLRRHADEFAAGQAYVYSVIDPSTDDVIGCIYIDPDTTEAAEPAPDAARAMVTSWVRADRAELDVPVASAVSAWLNQAGVFRSVRWPGRPDLTS